MVLRPDLLTNKIKQMNWDLYRKYGEYNKDGYYITNHSKWNFYAKNPKLYKRKKIIAWLFLLIPIAGIVPMSLCFKEMGLSIF